MTKKSKNKPNLKKPGGLPERLRGRSAQPGLMPFILAGLICLTLAFAMGTGAWWLFGKKLKPDKSPVNPPATPMPVSAVPSPLPSEASTASPTVAPAVTADKNLPAESIISPPPGTVAVTGGVFELGGQDLDNPARKVPLADFFIAETEVTNEQYQEFIVAAKYKTPLTWLKGGTIPLGRGQFPVTGITFQDAVEFCNWLAQKLGAKVRLPSEAEWELAARGSQHFLYPWGNDWRSKAAVWAQNGGKLQPVKSLPEGRAECGAFDMAGNAWEWTSDNALNDKGKPLLAGGKTQKNHQRWCC